MDLHMPALDQVLQPVSDVSVTGWSPTPVSPNITGDTYNDSTFVNATAIGGVFEVGLSAGATPGRGDAVTYPFLIVRRRKRNSGDENTLLKAALLQQGRQIAVRYCDVSTTAFVQDSDFQCQLSDEEVKLLSGFKDLTLRVEVLPAKTCTLCPRSNNVAATKLQVTVEGVEDDLCTSCDGFNGTWIMEGPSGCSWITNTNSDCSSGDPHDNVSVTGGLEEWFLQFRTGEGGIYARYACSVEEFDCRGPSVFDLVFVTGPECKDWPPFLITKPYP